jgi:hypothetical protein
MIDVGVGDHDGFHAQPVAFEDRLDLPDLVSGIYNNRFSGLFVSKDGTIAPQHAYLQNLVDH